MDLNTFKALNFPYDFEKDVYKRQGKEASEWDEEILQKQKWKLFFAIPM